jgi:hypothetical protein
MIKLKYNEVVRCPNPMATINPLKRGTGKTVTLQDRVDTLNNSFSWRSTVRSWRSQEKLFDVSRLPQVTKEKLGVLFIDEDIQRALDDKHCAYTIASPQLFDPALLQPVICIKTSKGRFISIDAQHTASTVAGLIDGGFMPGVTDWRQFEYPFSWIETDNLAHARRAFSRLNGKGKKQQTQYQQLRNSVFIIRIDRDRSDGDDVELEKKVSAAERHNCFPVEVKSDFARYPGTFSNIATFKTLSVKEVTGACSWHDRYFHYEQLHVSTFFIFRDLARHCQAAKLSLTPDLEHQLAALVQSLFGNLSQFQESVTEAYRKWSQQQWGYELPWDDKAYATSLVELYRLFGGSEPLPRSLLGQFTGLVDFFDQDLLDLALEG